MTPSDKRGLADILRVVRLEHRADLLDVFAEALIDAGDGNLVGWGALLDDLQAREEAIPERVCPAPGGCESCPDPAYCRRLRMENGLEDCGCPGLPERRAYHTVDCPLGVALTGGRDA